MSTRLTAALAVAVALAMTAGTARAESPRLRELLERVRARATRLDAAPAPTPDSADAVDELYHVNAQYRGAVTKGVDGLGDLRVRFFSQGEARFGIVLDATLFAKKNKPANHFKASMTYRTYGPHIEPVSQESHFSREAEKHREKILQNAPFIYLVRAVRFPGGGHGDVTYDVAGKSYRIHYARAGSRMEATVFDGPRWIGKFFLLAGPDDRPPYSYEKFRVTGRHDTVISFVCDRGRNNG